MGHYQHSLVLGWQRALGTAGAPIFKAVHGVRALGGDALEAVEFTSAGATRRIETRLLLHEGGSPTTTWRWRRAAR